MYVVVTQLDEVKKRFVSHERKTIADTLVRTRSHTCFPDFLQVHYIPLRTSSNYNFSIKVGQFVPHILHQVTQMQTQPARQSSQGKALIRAIFSSCLDMVWTASQMDPQFYNHQTCRRHVMSKVFCFRNFMSLTTSLL